MKQCLGENENRKKIAFLLRIKKIQTINQMKVEKTSKIERIVWSIVWKRKLSRKKITSNWISEKLNIKMYKLKFDWKSLRMFLFCFWGIRRLIIMDMENI